MIKNHAMFSVPISIGAIEFDNTGILKDIRNDNTDNQRSGINVQQSNFGLETKYDSFRTLQTRLDTELSPYLQFSGLSKGVSFHTNNYWFNRITSPTSYHMPHVHSFSRSVFSGVYFPLSIGTDFFEITDNPAPGSLVLLDPSRDIKNGVAFFQFIDRTQFFGTSVCLTPVEGHFVVFPSYIQHMVTPIVNHKERISVAFDIMLNRNNL